MYEFSPVSDRIKAMHERIRNRVIEIDDERAHSYGVLSEQ